MPYPIAHKMLTMYGDCFGGLEERWQCSVRIIPSGTSGVSQAQADACRVPAAKMFAEAFVSMKASHRFIGVKLAEINLDGKYPPGAVAYDSPGTPVVGAGTAGDNLPAQSAFVVSLDTAIPRGLAHEGRMYLPTLQGPIGADGKLTDGRVDLILGGVRTFILGINAIAGLGTVGVFSKTRTGAFNQVTGLRGGHVYDTMRSRRRQMAETYRSLAV